MSKILSDDYKAGFEEAKRRFIKLVQGPVKLNEGGHERVLMDVHWLELMVEEWEANGEPVVLTNSLGEAV